MPAPPDPSSARIRLERLIFESDTPAGRTFDVLLIVAIVLSTLSTALETVDSLQQRFALGFRILEWGFTILFAVEYFLRIWSARRRRAYVFSFFGLVDLIGWLPSLIGLFVPLGTQISALRTVRSIRVLRIFRVLKMVGYLHEAEVLVQALKAGSRKILVFLFAVLTLVILLGSLMYLIEGPEHGFRNIPVSIYWAIVTMTTVGYGDISPHTPLGQMLSSLIMILGYAILAVPTGIVSAEFIRAPQKNDPR